MCLACKVSIIYDIIKNIPLVTSLDVDNMSSLSEGNSAKSFLFLSILEHETFAQSHASYREQGQCT